VRWYHESGGNFGIHVNTVHVGPNAIHLPTIQDQIQAESRNPMFIVSTLSDICTAFYENPMAT